MANSILNRDENNLNVQFTAACSRVDSCKLWEYGIWKIFVVGWRQEIINDLWGLSENSCQKKTVLAVVVYFIGNFSTNFSERTKPNSDQLSEQSFNESNEILYCGTFL